jgi:SAM-dependent methyltransferase
VTGVKAYFERHATSFDSLYHDESQLRTLWNQLVRPSVYRRVDGAISLIEAMGHPTVLDIGCGSGRNSLAFAKAGASQVHGIDFSTPMLQLARRHVAGLPQEHKVSFECADLFTWDAEERTWDLVVALGVFDYFADIGGPLKRLFNLSSKAACFSIRHPTLIRMPIRKWRYQVMKCPIYFYPRHVIELRCQEAGFEDGNLEEGGNGSFFVKAYR